MIKIPSYEEELICRKEDKKKILKMKLEDVHYLDIKENKNILIKMMKNRT